jgi:hypothetical protein
VLRGCAGAMALMLQDAAAAVLAHADAFRWQRGVTPLSHERLMLFVPPAYMAGVLLLRALLGGRAVPLGPLPALHNLVLMLWSLAMFVGTAHEAWRLTAASGDAVWLLCLPVGTAVQGRLWWWSYVYYVSKARKRLRMRPRRPRRRNARAHLSRAPRPRVCACSTTSCWTPCCACSRRSRSRSCTCSTTPWC